MGSVNQKEYSEHNSSYGIIKEKFSSNAPDSSFGKQGIPANKIGQEATGNSNPGQKFPKSYAHKINLIFNFYYSTFDFFDISLLDWS